MQKIKKKEKRGQHQHKNKGSYKKPPAQSGQKRHTITVVVKPVQREQEEVDSDKIVPLFEQKYKKKSSANVLEWQNDLQTQADSQEKWGSSGRSFSTGQCAEI